MHLIRFRSRFDVVSTLHQFNKQMNFRQHSKHPSILFLLQQFHNYYTAHITQPSTSTQIEPHSVYSFRLVPPSSRKQFWYFNAFPTYTLCYRRTWKYVNIVASNQHQRRYGLTWWKHKETRLTWRGFSPFAIRRVANLPRTQSYVLTRFAFCGVFSDHETRRKNTTGIIYSTRYQRQSWASSHFLSPRWRDVMRAL